MIKNFSIHGLNLFWNLVCVCSNNPVDIRFMLEYKVNKYWVKRYGTEIKFALKRINLFTS